MWNLDSSSGEDKYCISRLPEAKMHLNNQISCVTVSFQKQCFILRLRNLRKCGFSCNIWAVQEAQEKSAAAVLAQGIDANSALNVKHLASEIKSQSTWIALKNDLFVVILNNILLRKCRWYHCYPHLSKFLYAEELTGFIF